MGMSAEIFAIGPFSADIADALSYPAEHYKNTRAGVPVVTSLFTYMPGSSSSREFARLLGITDPWDFNQHKLRASVVDIASLKTFFGALHGSEDYIADLERFVRLRDKGFDFYFLPNG